jgi:hypothetical protein
MPHKPIFYTIQLSSINDRYSISISRIFHLSHQTTQLLVSATGKKPISTRNTSTHNPPNLVLTIAPKHSVGGSCIRIRRPDRTSHSTRSPLTQIQIPIHHAYLALMQPCHYPIRKFARVRSISTTSQCLGQLLGLGDCRKEVKIVSDWCVWGVMMVYLRYWSFVRLAEP